MPIEWLNPGDHDPKQEYNRLGNSSPDFDDPDRTTVTLHSDLFMAEVTRYPSRGLTCAAFTDYPDPLYHGDTSWVWAMPTDDEILEDLRQMDEQYRTEWPA